MKGLIYCGSFCSWTAMVDNLLITVLDFKKNVLPGIIIVQVFQKYVDIRIPWDWYSWKCKRRTHALICLMCRGSLNPTTTRYRLKQISLLAASKWKYLICERYIPLCKDSSFVVYQMNGIKDSFFWKWFWTDSKWISIPLCRIIETF